MYTVEIIEFVRQDTLFFTICLLNDVIFGDRFELLLHIQEVYEVVFVSVCRPLSPTARCLVKGIKQTMRKFVANIHV